MERPLLVGPMHRGGTMPRKNAPLTKTTVPMQKIYFLTKIWILELKFFSLSSAYYVPTSTGPSFDFWGKQLFLCISFQDHINLNLGNLSWSRWYQQVSSVADQKIGVLSPGSCHSSKMAKSLIQRPTNSPPAFLGIWEVMIFIGSVRLSPKESCRVIIFFTIIITIIIIISPLQIQ